MGRRVVHSPHAHMVFVTERRGKVFNIAHLKRLEEICRDVRSDFEAEPKEFNGEERFLGQVPVAGARARPAGWPARPTPSAIGQPPHARSPADRP